MKNELVLDVLEVQELSFNEVQEVDGGGLGSFITGIGIAVNAAPIVTDFLTGLGKGFMAGMDNVMQSQK